MARVRAAGAGGRRGEARPVGAGVGSASSLPQHTTGIRLGSAPARPAPSPHGPAPRGGPPKGPPDADPRPARAGRSPREASQQRRPADPGHRRRMPHRAGAAQPLGIHAARPAPSTPPKMLLIAAPGTLERKRRPAPREGIGVAFLDGSVPTLRHERRRGAVPPPPADCVQSRSSVRFTRLCVSPNLSEAAPSFITTRT